jgi:hypothetical protein
VRVYLREPGIVDDAQRMLLQALLGSDPTREFLNWRSALEGHPEECILFELADAVETEFCSAPQAPTFVPDSDILF